MSWHTHTDGPTTWQSIDGIDCTIYLEPRPHYCDRGDFIAKIFLKEGATVEQRLRLNLDEQDGWPRYYFDEGRAKLEIEAWLKKRKQEMPTSTT